MPPAAPRELRAAHVWAAPGRHWSPGVVRVDARGAVQHVGPLRRGRRAEPWLLAPGLVNAHVHLQLPSLAAPREFLAWLRTVIASRRVADPLAAARQHTRLAAQALLRSGCTAVGEIDSLGTSPAVLGEMAMAGRCYQEVLGFQLDSTGARLLLQSRAATGRRGCPTGWSPHAPYSCSMALLRAVARGGMPLSVHIAEHPAELQLLNEARGPFRDLLHDLGRWPPAFHPPRCSPVGWLARAGALHRRTLVVHAQHATSRDIQLIARARASIAVCPPTIEFFARPAPPVAAWLRAGANVALGTDSAASCDGPLSMVVAMRQARRLWPDLPPQTILAMATSRAARAIVRPSLGQIRVGGRADLCAFALDTTGDLEDAIDAATSGTFPVAAVWLAGTRVA